MTISPSHVLDRLVDERLGHSWHLLRQGDDEVLTYEVYGPDGRRVELGQANGVHLWLSLPEGWRTDTHADDLESLVYEFEEFISLTERILRGDVAPPSDAIAPRARWQVPGSSIIMRAAPKKDGPNL